MNNEDLYKESDKTYQCVIPYRVIPSDLREALESESSFVSAYVKQIKPTDMIKIYYVEKDQCISFSIPNNKTSLGESIYQLNYIGILNQPNVTDYLIATNLFKLLKKVQRLKGGTSQC